MKSPVTPLTHHEILSWVGPFTRAGWQVDLAASDRIARRLLFKPVDHEAAELGGISWPALRETLQLESPAADLFCLTRLMRLPNGLVATLQIDGPQPGELLARIAAVPIHRQLCSGPGFVIAQSHRLVGQGATGSAAPSLLLTRAVAQIDAHLGAHLGAHPGAEPGPLTLSLEQPSVRGLLAELTLTAPPGIAIALPDDLLAVLGRDWSRLGEAAVGWRSSLRLRSGLRWRASEFARSRDAEAKLAQAAAHIASSLAEPPARFHERQRAARWRVYARRSVPLLACIALVFAVASVPRLNLADNSPWRMLIFNAPPLLLILVFCLRELPRIEIPPWPRRATATAWHTAAAQGDER